MRRRPCNFTDFSWPLLRSRKIVALDKPLTILNSRTLIAAGFTSALSGSLRALRRSLRKRCSRARARAAARRRRAPRPGSLIEEGRGKSQSKIVRAHIAERIASISFGEPTILKFAPGAN